MCLALALDVLPEFGQCRLAFAELILEKQLIFPEESCTKHSVNLEDKACYYCPLIETR